MEKESIDSSWIIDMTHIPSNEDHNPQCLVASAQTKSGIVFSKWDDIIN